MTYDEALVSVLMYDEDQVRERARHVGIDPESAVSFRGDLSRVIDAAISVGRQWHQFGVEVRSDGDVGAFFDSELLELADAWARGQPQRRVMFVRKRPGILLRIESATGEHPDPGIRRREADQLITDLRQVFASRLAIAPFGVYEPEAGMLGGLPGLTLAHTFFATDSLSVLEYHRQGIRGSRPQLGATEYSLGTLFVVLSALTQDRGEHWDVWRRVFALREDSIGKDVLATGDSSLAVRARAWVRSALKNPPAAASAWSAGGRMMETAQLLSAALREVEADLEISIRRVLPVWVIHHWNRMGFDLTVQRILARLVVDECDPRDSPI